MLLVVTDSPEITGSASNVLTSTRNSQSTFTPQTTSSPSNSSSKGGTIAGGVVGGIAGAALIAGVMAWTITRRRRARSALSTAVIDDQSDMGRGAVPYPIVADVPRLYVRGFFLSFGWLPVVYESITREWLITLPRTPRTQARTRHKHRPR